MSSWLRSQADDVQAPDAPISRGDVRSLYGFGDDHHMLATLCERQSSPQHQPQGNPMSDHTAAPIEAFAAEVMAGLVQRLSQSSTACNTPAEDIDAWRCDEDFLRRLREAGL